MSILGIVAEYDPFHNGHLHHLREAAAAVSPDAVLIALSGPFKQRGQASLLSPYARAESALEFGADAVLALPVCWTVHDAEHYALGAVSMLASLGATHLAFGAETADLDLLQRTAELLENQPSSLRDALHAALAEGNGYPSALAAAASVCFPQCRKVLNHPNNILAVCYLRAILRLRLQLKPVLIARSGEYRADRIVHDTPSASAVRESLLRGAWEDALAALPSVSAKAVRKAFMSGETPDQRRLDTLFLNGLRSMTPEQAACLPDCPEGLDAALLKAASHADSREELISALTTRRYSAARISRLCTRALLGITAARLERLALPDRALLLAIKKNPSLTGLWKNAPVHVAAASEWQKAADPADLAAWRVWSLSCGLPASWPFTCKLK